MRDGVKAEDTADFCRQELLELYADGFLSRCTEVGPCQDEELLEKATQFLLKEPELSETFTVFPFRLTVSEGCGGSSESCWTFLQSFIKATELLETLCVYLVLQPWKKEIKTLKTFTGPFVYCLQPVFSSSNLQSVLASIGYLPHTAASEYRLSEDVNPDRSMVVGFELLLARVECHRLLRLHDRNQMGRQEWLEILRRRLSLEETTDRMVTGGRKMEEKNEDEDVQEVSLHLNSRLSMNPLPKPRHRHINSEDQSIMEMQMNYPDLAFRGRPLLPDKPQRENSWSSNLLHPTGYSDATDEGETADVPKRHSVKSTRTTSRTKNRVDRKADVFAKNNKCSGSSDRVSGQAAAPGDSVSSSICVTDGGRDDDQHSRHPAIGVRAGLTGEQSVDPEEDQLAAEASAWTQTAADPLSLSSKDRTQDVVEQEEMSDQPFVQMTRDVRRKQSDMKGEEKTKKERRRKERKASREVQGDEQNLTKPAMETAPPSYAAKGRTRLSKPDPLVMKAPCPPSLPEVGTTDPQKTHEDGKGQREETERAEPGRGEEEQLAQSFVIL